MRWLFLLLLVMAVAWVGTVDPLSAAFVSVVGGLGLGFVMGQWVSFMVIERPWWEKGLAVACALPFAVGAASFLLAAFWWAVYRIAPVRAEGAPLMAAQMVAAAVPWAILPSFLCGTLAINLPTTEEMRKRREGEE